MRESTRRWVAFPVLLAALGIGISALPAEEVVVQNDSLSGADQGVIQVGFDPGESAAAWLTSPCAGNIVAVQVFWRSVTGVEPQSIEDSIKIFEAGSFPVPGTLLADIVGPLMTDGALNEFRFLDENQTIPLLVPVTNGQHFVVSFKFLNDPDMGVGPSLVNDTDGCQAGKNAIDAVGIGWISSCLLGVGGDWVIRAVVNCETGMVGPGSVPNGGDTPGEPLRMDLSDEGALVLTWSESCSNSDTTYEVYHGFIGAYYSHFRLLCSTEGATTTSFDPDTFDRYYLVVPTDEITEGSYGRKSNGNERPQGGNACRDDQVVTCPVLP